MKNLLLILAILLPATAVFSQLTVKPNATSTTDSYIYVQDEVLFVEQGINLTKNTYDATTEASIYLRNQAQLVQGTTSTANSGSGLISVFQNAPDDDSWDYSVWSSPVNNPTLNGGAAGNQKYGVLRIHDSITKTNSIVTQTHGGFNGAESPLKISTRWLYRYPVGGPFNRIYTNDEINPGYGFIMKGVGTTNHNQRYDFRGRPNNGDMTVAVLANKYTLSGNPYPSALDLNRVFYDTSDSDNDGDTYTGNNEINSFRFYDEDRSIDSHYYIDNKAGYGIWIPMGSNPNTTNPGAYTVAPFLNYNSTGNPSGGQTGTGSIWERRYAPIAQGFMIFGESNGNIIIKNQHRKYVVEGVSNDSQYRIQNNGGGEKGYEIGLGDGNPNPNQNPTTENQIPQMRIYTIFKDSHFRDMVLAFSDNATDSYDRGFDAIHPMDGVRAEIYFPIGENDDPYVIQTVPFAIDKQIPISITLNQQSKFSIQAVEVINCESMFSDAYIYDSLERTFQKFTGNQESEFILPAGVYEDRFFIVFNSLSDRMESSGVTEAIDNVKESVDFYQNNPSRQMEVSNPERYEIQSALVYDMSGKLVINKTNIGAQNRFNISTANLADGVYIIKLTTADNVDIDYRMIIQNR